MPLESPVAATVLVVVPAKASAAIAVSAKAAEEFQPQSPWQVQGIFPAPVQNSLLPPPPPQKGQGEQGRVESSSVASRASRQGM